MNFGEAQAAIERGSRVRRAGWNGKGMWVAKITSWNGTLSWKGTMPDSWRGNLSFYVMFTADGHLVPWLISQTDAQAGDWEEISEEEGRQ